MANSEVLDAAPLVVAFRTAIWSEEVARLARRLRHFAPRAHFVLLMDQSRGPLPAESFAKLAHTGDFSAFGLPPANVAGNGADYPLYLLREAYPQASHYAVVNHDVAVNTDIMPMLRTAQAERIDLIVHGLRGAQPDWGHHDAVKKHFTRPLRAFLPFFVVSGRALDKMLAERRRLAAILPQGGAAQDWPIPEGFIPSAVGMLPGAQFKKLVDFVKLPLFAPHPVQHIDDPLSGLPGTLSFPVAGGDQFIKRRVAKATFDDIFDPKSNLLRQLGFCNPAKFTKLLFDNVKRERDITRLQVFLATAEAKNWPVAAQLDNLALFKPALMSSAWRAGPNPDLASLAGGGNNGVVDGGYGFHTDMEDEPWWQVDLQSQTAVSHVMLFNRLEHAARCRKLRVSGSLDGSTWETIVEKRDDTLFGGADGHPLVFTLRTRPVVRFIRLTNLERNFLHLDDVQILGKVVS